MTDAQADEQLDEEIVVPPGTPLTVSAWLGPALLLLAGSAAVLVWASGAVWRAPANGGMLVALGALGAAAAVLLGTTGASAYRELTVAATARYRTAGFLSFLVLGIVGLTAEPRAAGAFVVLAGLAAAGSDRPAVRALRQLLDRRRTAVLIVSGIIAALGLVLRPLIFHLGFGGVFVAETVVAAFAGFLFGFALPRRSVEAA